MSAEAIRIVSPMITEVRASILYEAEPHVTWSVGYAPELDDENGRFLIANLHAAGAEGRVDVEISAIQLGGSFAAVLDGREAERYEDDLARAEGLETLYDVARITAKGLLGTIDVDLEVPLSSPEPEITQLVKSPESDA